MRSYRIFDEAPGEQDEYSQVVPIGAGGRPYAGPLGLASRPRPWMPRDTSLPAASPRVGPPQVTVREPGITRTHRLMVASFVIICVGMLLGMVLIRFWDEASRTVAASPSDGNVTPSRPTGAQPPSTASSDFMGASPQPGTGAVTTEIRVLQPNYTIAPGDTLGSIARRHGTSVEALASINNLENRNSLGVGQKLIIP
jgi:LysM domain